jgi:hypothetical protein
VKENNMGYVENPSQGIEFKEESDYEDHFQKGVSINDIILRHIRKISDICCQEFTGGYWQRKPVKTAGGVLFTEEYHEDVRQAYCNAVDFLIDVLYPLADTEFKKYVDSNESNTDFSLLEIKEKVNHKRKTFKQINTMFNRVNFWSRSDSSNE